MTGRGSGKDADLLDFSVDRKTIGKSALHSVFMQLLVRLKGLITMPVLTYFLKPGEIGAFNLILVTSAMLVPLFSLNLTDGPAIHFVQERSRERIVTMYNTVTNSVLLCSALLFPLFWFAMYRFGGSYYRLFPLMALLLFSNIFYKVVTYVLAVFQKTAMLVNNAVIKDVGGTVLTVIVVAAGYSFTGMVLVQVAMNFAAGLLVYRFTRRELAYAPVIDRTLLLKFLKMALPLLPVFFFSWLIQSSDSFFLAYFKGDDAVGKYSIIYSFASLVLSLTLALNFFWFPVSARLWVDDREKYRQVFVSVFAGFAALLGTLVLLFELNSALIVRLLVRRPEYQDAHVITGIIALAYSMQVLITLLTAPLYSNGNTKSIFSCYLVGGVANAVLNLLLIPGWGILGAAVSTALSYLVIVLLMGYLNYRLVRFAFLDRRLLPVAGTFAVLWRGAVWLRESAATHQLLLADAGLVLAVALGLYTIALNGREKQYLGGMFAGVRSKLGAGG
ncbi:oligosaccharide flippase family protein [Geomesophilobacter sediminis]|uniref:Oligosaccharide flippase family protein n=1 Tax=Geomesophilobacter sediminis TaxID=2798584 RepID=A0A8J7LUX2_9BACT|nr:oligosaccharide flippase family protein [Geomesophilobacter sediminis]MBJ6724255.1 oligosaccharide flippase family protein [Geomesophilobacter sediminis]